MKVVHIIGADISKKTIDLFCFQSSSHLKITNDVNGFKRIQLWISKLGVRTKSLAVVMEHTGYYSYHFENFLHQNQIRFSKVSALEIKRSMGLVRGKNDKIDSQRIARFGHEKQDRLRPETLTPPELQNLQILVSTRALYVKQRSSLLCAIKEHQIILSPKASIIEGQQRLVGELTRQIKGLEKEMKTLLSKPDAIGDNFRLLTSIVGIGLIIGATVLIKTKNFTRFTNRKKFSCYCGSAPFDHSSGTSIMKKTRISHLADKTMKTLLTQAAKTAIQHDKELKHYYQRRTESGKTKRSTINVVRNKLIHRMFAIVKRQTPYINQVLKRA